MELFLVVVLPLLSMGVFGTWYWRADDARRTRRVLRRTRVTNVAALVDGRERALSRARDHARCEDPDRRQCLRA
ncbi:MAG: hypothetical protein ABI591_06815 [Kofleriaceae bacterium]